MSSVFFFCFVSSYFVLHWFCKKYLYNGNCDFCFITLNYLFMCVCVCVVEWNWKLLVCFVLFFFVGNILIPISFLKMLNFFFIFFKRQNMQKLNLNSQIYSWFFCAIQTKRNILFSSIHWNNNTFLHISMTHFFYIYF